MLNADLKHCQQADGPYLIATTLGAPSSARFFAPKGGIRAPREPLSQGGDPCLNRAENLGAKWREHR